MQIIRIKGVFCNPKTNTTFSVQGVADTFQINDSKIPFLPLFQPKFLFIGKNLDKNLLKNLLHKSLM